jgi:dTDP-glucose pyrophosphorylase
VDAIVLAAGRNDRLRGYVPAYMKPLILVNGEPIIKTLVQGLATVAGRIIIVCAPQNATQIVDVLSGVAPLAEVLFCLQPEATGPRGAVYIGAQMVTRKSVMVVCADNVIPLDDIARATAQHRLNPELTTIVTRDVPSNGAARFTRVYQGAGKVKEGPMEEWEPTDHNITCWVGPLVFGTETLKGALAATQRETKVSVLIDDHFECVSGNTTDIGVPEALV